jgi:transcription factor Dp-1
MADEEGEEEVGVKPLPLRLQAELIKKRLETIKTSTLRDLYEYLAQLRGITSEAGKKGVQRRVYDIINVFLAVGLVSQQKHVICWLGFPELHEGSEEETRLLVEKQKILADIELARSELSLIHNEIRIYSSLCEANNHVLLDDHESTLPFPFITLTTQQQYISISVNEDDTEYWIDVPDLFEIGDESQIVQALHQAKPVY